MLTEGNPLLLMQQTITQPQKPETHAACSGICPGLVHSG